MREEPYEQLTVDVEEQHQATVMEKLGTRGNGVLIANGPGKGPGDVERRVM